MTAAVVRMDLAAAANLTDRSVMPPKPSMDRRTRALLEAPLMPLLLRLAAPNILLMLAQSATGLIETYFVGQLGTALSDLTNPLPGISRPLLCLVRPILQRVLGIFVAAFQIATELPPALRGESQSG